MKFIVVLLILVLCVLHHDVWWWDTPAPLGESPTDEDRTRGLVLGFMPIGLAWHSLISIAAGCVWYLATKFCWPHALDEEKAAS